MLTNFCDCCGKEIKSEELTRYRINEIHEYVGVIQTVNFCKNCFQKYIDHDVFKLNRLKK